MAVMDTGKAGGGERQATGVSALVRCPPPAALSASSPGPAPAPALTRLCTPGPGRTLGSRCQPRGDLCSPAQPREPVSSWCSPDVGLSWSRCVCFLHSVEQAPEAVGIGQLFLR